MRLRSLPVFLLAGLALLSGIAGTAIGAPAPARPLPTTRPSPDELERAYQRRDPVELERLGSRIGAVRLVALVERGTPAARRAALGALELTSGSLDVLPRLIASAAARDADPAVALETLQSVRRIAERVPRGEIDLDELPGDLPRAAGDALTAFVSNEDRAAALRVQAVYALAALTTLDAGASRKLATLVTTRDPEVRRAIADALPASAAPTLGKLIAEDGNDQVALAAAESLCRDVPAPGTERKNDRALQRALELAPAARQRLRALVRDAALAEPDRLDVVPCLRAGAQKLDERPADLEVLRELGKGADGPMKKRARTFGGR